MKQQIMNLIEQYERRLRTATTMVREETYISLTQRDRVVIKSSCYRTIISELKQILN